MLCSLICGIIGIALLVFVVTLLLSVVSLAEGIPRRTDCGLTSDGCGSCYIDSQGMSQACIRQEDSDTLQTALTLLYVSIAINFIMIVVECTACVYGKELSESPTLYVAANTINVGPAPLAVGVVVNSPGSPYGGGGVQQYPVGGVQQYPVGGVQQYPVGGVQQYPVGVQQYPMGIMQNQYPQPISAAAVQPYNPAVGVPQQYPSIHT
jgi:hypothetical protein